MTGINTIITKTPRHYFLILAPLFFLSSLFLSCTGGEGGIKITDRSGQVVGLPPKIERIISVSPSNTEIIVGLGLGEKLVATDRHSKDIDGIDKNTPNIDFFYPDAEAIISLDPDIIIANGLNRVGAGEDPLAILRAAHISVVYVPMSNSIEGIYGDIAFIAGIFKVSERGEEIISKMKAEIDAISETGKTIQNKKTVYFEIGPPPSIATLGGGTYLNEMIEIVGAINIFGGEKGILFPNNEQILSRNPDVILTNVNYTPAPLQELKNRTGFNLISAVKNNAVYLVDANTSARPSQNIVYALREIARDIYPEYYTGSGGAASH
jgi:iron complex transport system substrate-binding protein